jgi:hypothetical protein
MRQFAYILLGGILLCSSGCTKKEDAVIRLDDIAITEDEFLRSFQSSAFAAQGQAGLKSFLDQYISKKMILREAERLGLDKDPEFLSGIQQYWEQELMKMTLSKKNQEFLGAGVSDRIVEAYYNEHSQDMFAGRPLADDVRAQIKAFLARERQKRMLQQWVEGLKRKTSIQVDYKRLGIE